MCVLNFWPLGLIVWQAIGDIRTCNLEYIYIYIYIYIYMYKHKNIFLNAQDAGMFYHKVYKQVTVIKVQKNR